MRIQRSFIDELITRVEIVDLIDSYVPLHKSGQNFVACCPFHHEKTPSFIVFPPTQHYHCFGCEAHGTAVTFLMEYAHLSYIEALQELASRVGIQIVYESGTAPAELLDQEQLYSIMEQAAQYYRHQLRQPHAHEAVSYLKNRGLKGETARDFGLGYAPAGWDKLLKNFKPHEQTLLLKVGLIKQHSPGHFYDFFRDRILFPIHNAWGRIVAFGGRAIKPVDHSKYLNSPETPLFQKSRELYGWYFARKIRPLSQIILVEGYMDVLMLAQYGICNTVATLGTAMTREQISRLFKEVSQITFCFDGDEAGKKAAWRALETVLPLLYDGRQINFAFLPQNEDPDSFVRQVGAEKFRDHLKQAMSLSDFFFAQPRWQQNHSLENKAKLAQEAKKFLKELPSGIYRDLMLQKASELIQIHPEKLNIPIEQTTQKKIVKKNVPLKSFRELPLEHQAMVCLLHKPALSQSITLSHEALRSFTLKDINLLITGIESLKPHSPSSNTLEKLIQQQDFLKDIELLIEMIELSKAHPHLTLAGMIEHWRETPHKQLLEKLSQQKSELHNNIDQEFGDAIQQLYQRLDEQRIEFLIQKATLTPLTEEEKQELRNLRRIS